MRITQNTRLKEVTKFLISEFGLYIHGIVKRLPPGTDFVIQRSAVKGNGPPENIEFEGIMELDIQSTTPHWWWADSTVGFYSARWAGYSNVDDYLRFAHECKDRRFSGIFDKFMLGREELFKREFDPEQEAETDNRRKTMFVKDLPPIIAEQVNINFRKTHGFYSASPCSK